MGSGYAKNNTFSRFSSPGAINSSNQVIPKLKTVNFGFFDMMAEVRTRKICYINKGCKCSFQAFEALMSLSEQVRQECSNSMTNYKFRRTSQIPLHSFNAANYKVSTRVKLILSKLSSQWPLIFILNCQNYYCLSSHISLKGFSNDNYRKTLSYRISIACRTKKNAF